MKKIMRLSVETINMALMRQCSLAFLSLLLCFGNAQEAATQTANWSWQKPHAKVLPNGDLEYAPEPFVFQKGAAVRYIDYETGSDDKDGASQQTAWKHHPWDPNATGQAKSCKGIYTYIFKRGVIYRGMLNANESGESGNPIRLTSDPSWGSGEACFYGSEAVTGWKKGGNDKMPETDKVWSTELTFAPRLVGVVDRDGKMTRLKLARTPNWEMVDPDNILSQCWTWENKQNGMVDGKNQLGIDTQHLTEPADYYLGAYVWSEWGLVMSSPFGVKVEKFDPVKKSISFGGPWGPGGGWLNGLWKGQRYWLEDKPQYLDEPGEFWFDKKEKGESGTLYVRLPGDVEPSSVTVEAAQHRTLIESKGMNHVDISGLSFRFGNIWWFFEHQSWQGDSDTAAIRLRGSGTNIAIHHCRFEYLPQGINMIAIEKKDRIDNISITDNEIGYADHGAMAISQGPFTRECRPGSLGRVQVLRNRIYQVGFRSVRTNGNFALTVRFPEVAEIAGNIIDRCGSAGIMTAGGKDGPTFQDEPLTRLLIHHNKVTAALLLASDWGEIESGMGGPVYIYDNVTGNPGGMRLWGTQDQRWGPAYYIDGAYKHYLFNNIAWGTANDPKNMFTASAAGFAEIIGYQCSWFNNTVYKFLRGSVRTAPEAGRNKYMGNIFQDISSFIFSHSDAKRMAPNAHDAAKQADAFNYESNAYTQNVFYDVAPKIWPAPGSQPGGALTGRFAVFEATGGDHPDLDSFAKAMADHKALASDGGVMADKAPLVDAANHDFRPAPGSAAIHHGVKVFVPWSLVAVVGEWNFTPDQADPTQVIDEHWYLRAPMLNRQTYHKSPMFPLKALNVTLADYVDGPLEDWTRGALKLNGRDQYLTLANIVMPPPQDNAAPEVKPATPGGKPAKKEIPMDFDPQVAQTSFIVEVYLKPESQASGIVMEKMTDRGYRLVLNDRGTVQFTVVTGATRQEVTSAKSLADGQWHHLIAECDRQSKKLTLYVDGKKDAQAEGIGPDESLASTADLFVGGTPKGHCLAATLDFLRLSRGSLADAQTSIEELYAWEFDGPQLRDFCGRKPAGKRDAGAIHSSE